MVFLDTCVFLYAAGAHHPEKASCERILEKVARQELEATTNAEVLQEIVYVLTRRDRRRDAIALTKHVGTLVPGMLSVTRADMLLALELLEKLPLLPPRDAVHAATMRNSGISVIVSVDAHFDRVDGITRRSPADGAGRAVVDAPDAGPPR